MKETVKAFEARTGQRYSPPPGAGRPLLSKDACPTLFRYPGPLGLGALLDGQDSALGPPDAPYLWLADKPLRTGDAGVKLFGVAVVLQPLSFSPAKTNDRGVYLGVNQIAPAGTVAFLPAPMVGKRLVYDRLRDADDLRKAAGKGYDAAVSEARDELSAYLEELSALDRAGAPPAGKAWHAVSPKKRKKLLSDFGVKGRWTR